MYFKLKFSYKQKSVSAFPFPPVFDHFPHNRAIFLAQENTDALTLTSCIILTILIFTDLIRELSDTSKHQNILLKQRIFCA